METFTIKNLTFFYPESQKPALNDINLTVSQGEFITVCGKSGSGKSTLLRHLKGILTPHGVRQGEIFFEGRNVFELPLREQAEKIGFILQNPESQIVTDKVWHELAFGLENLGLDRDTIRLRAAEAASFFGIQQWFDRSVFELSGGQKQLLNLAAIIAMQPSVLLLDEPTGQLDPISASEFLEAVKKINRELGITVIITEHRLEETFPISDRALIMDNGRIIADDIPSKAGESLKELGHDMFIAMPSPMRIWAGVENNLPCPLTVREGRRWLENIIPSIDDLKKDTKENENIENSPPVIELYNVWYKYGKAFPDALKGLSLEIKKGQLYCIVGGNGTGKTTALNVISGICKPYRGKVLIFGNDIKRLSDREMFYRNIALLPQNPQALFLGKTVELDLLSVTDSDLPERERQKQLIETAILTEIEELLQRHPYDLSGGEQQRAALAKVLLRKPKILLLDEPTKGMDAHFKQKFANILFRLCRDGITVVMVSHDIEFCAEYASECAMLFNGEAVAKGSPKSFFAGNSFYTTAANRMARGRFKNAVTAEDVIEKCRKIIGEKEEFKEK